MTLNSIVALLDASILTQDVPLDKEVYSAFSSDMMSDVLAFTKQDSILITGLCNPQVMRTAEMLDIICIIFIQGKLPNENMIMLAKESNICVISTQMSMFTACGKLFEAGLTGGAPLG